MRGIGLGKALVGNGAFADWAEMGFAAECLVHLPQIERER